MGTSIKINTILLDFYIKMLYICEIKLPKYMNYIYALVDTSKEVNIILKQLIQIWELELIELKNI